MSILVMGQEKIKMQNVQKNALFTCKSAFLSIAYRLMCFELHYWKYLKYLFQIAFFAFFFVK